jgi:hypothetical protein
VVVYGDSFIAAEGTPEPETFTAVLERELTERVGATEVLNAGVTGYGPDQILLRMEDELSALRPQLVVVGLFAGNDFGDLLRNKLFRLSEEGGALPNTPVLDEALRRDFTAPLAWSSIQVVRALQSALQRGRSQPASGAGAPRPDRTATRLAHRIEEYQNYVVARDDTVRNFMADEYDADVSLQPDSAPALYRRRLMAAIVDRMRGVADASGARLLLLIIPEWCDAGGPCDEVAVRRQYPAYRPEGLTRALSAIASTQSVFHLDLFEPFTGAGASTLYYPRDQHWNPAGQRLAAEQLADLVSGAGWLSARTPAR